MIWKIARKHMKFSSSWWLSSMHFLQPGTTRLLEDICRPCRLPDSANLKNYIAYMRLVTRLLTVSFSDLDVIEWNHFDSSFRMGTGLIKRKGKSMVVWVCERRQILFSPDLHLVRWMAGMKKVGTYARGGGGGYWKVGRKKAQECHTTKCVGCFWSKKRKITVSFFFFSPFSFWSSGI